MIVITYLMPDNPGLGAGLANAGSAFSSVFYCTIGQVIMNPSGLEPTFIVQEGHRTSKYFDLEIALKFPYYNMAVAIFCLAVAFILIPTMKLPQPPPKPVPTHPQNPNPQQNTKTLEARKILSSPTFISLWLFYLFIGGLMPFFTSNLKSFGLPYYPNTTLQTFSALQTICIYLGRVCGGILIDRFGLKKFNIGILLSFGIFLIVFVFGRENLIFFSFAYFLIFCIGGSHDVMVGSTLRLVYGRELMVHLQAPLQ